MTDSLQELDFEIATKITLWTPIPNEDGWQSPDKSRKHWPGPPEYSVDIRDAMEVIDRMYKEHQLSCRIAYTSDQQVAVAFYTAAGAQHILTEKMDVKGWDTSDSISTAICRAAIQAHTTIAGLKEIASR